MAILAVSTTKQQVFFLVDWSAAFVVLKSSDFFGLICHYTEQKTEHLVKCFESLKALHECLIIII